MEFDLPTAAVLAITKQQYSYKYEYEHGHTPLTHHNLGGWLREQLARFTYKPGWRLAIVHSGGFSFTGYGAEYSLRILVECEDTYHPGRMVSVGCERPIWHAEHMDEASFARFVAYQLKEVEIHESQEWFKRDGVIWDNPHKEE